MSPTTMEPVVLQMKLRKLHMQRESLRAKILQPDQTINVFDKKICPAMNETMIVSGDKMMRKKRVKDSVKTQPRTKRGQILY